MKKQINEIKKILSITNVCYYFRRVTKIKTKYEGRLNQKFDNKISQVQHPRNFFI